jgi:hypothetical protein
MSPGTVARLRNAVAVICNTERYGGRLIQRDDSTIILKDYRCMNMRLFDLVQEQFPHVDITVQSHEDSASGFVVIFVVRDSHSVVRGSSFAQAVMLSCILAVTLSYKLIYATFFLVWI